MHSRLVWFGPPYLRNIGVKANMMNEPGENTDPYSCRKFHV